MRTTMQTMTIEAHCKVNFTLEVLGKRADGYHALRSVVIPVSLSDTLEIEPTDGEISSDTGFPDDLCVKAAKVVLGEDSKRGARIHVAKRIPAGGGLGGGSADAAATLVALNEIYALGLSPAQLAEKGALVGSDVPALVLSRFAGAVLMEGRGEFVSPLGVGLPHLDLVLVNPGVFSSTPAVFRACSPRVTNDAEILYNIRVSLKSGDAAAIAESLQNDLEAPAMKLHPEIADAKSALQKAGAEGVTMSGSGSTVFGIAKSGEEADLIAAKLKSQGYGAWHVTTVCPVV
ncbi:MAG: 4-(cytidine 5'-diphospho)-2-C-methyl-D-erythritol kinase [Lentisphaerae bacterium]|nr:4-(cytidine 5'-diphospho)-2-C-methyl-D-erythritol kinase [Lentisphaerota bacterium]